MNIAKSKEGVKKEMLYDVKYKHKFGWRQDSWVEISALYRLEDLYNLLKWMEEKSEDNILISIEPLKRREK